MKVVQDGFRFNSAIAPARQNQFSISCWPEASTLASEVLRHSEYSPDWSAE